MKRFRMRTLQRRLFVYIVFFLAIPTLLTFFLSDRPLIRNIESKIGNSAHETLNLARLTVDETASKMMTAVTLLTMDPSVIYILQDHEQTSEYEKYWVTKTAFEKVFSVSLHKFDYQLMVIGNNGKYYASSYFAGFDLDKARTTEWYRRLSAPPYHFTWLHPSDIHAPAQAVTLGKAIYDPNSGRQVGAALVSVSLREFTSILRELDGQVYLLDDAGAQVAPYGENSELTNGLSDEVIEAMRVRESGRMINEEHDGKFMLIYNTMQINGWKIVQKLSYDAVFKEIWSIRKLNRWTIIVILAAFLLITFFISHHITRPLSRLRRKMYQLDDVRLAAYIQSNGTDEIAELMTAYNRMLKQIKELIANLESEQKKKENMRFKALQAQMNPHFILNTLNNIKWMAYMRQDHEVADMITDLAIIMEAGIGRGEDMVPLSQELTYIVSYVHLHQIKLNGRIDLRVAVPQSLLACSVIKFTLQPLVENCICHGFERLDRQGIIAIDACRAGEQLIITVKDNGRGIAEEKIAEITGQLRLATSDKQYERLGLLSLHERIRLHYGMQYGLSVRNLPEGGCEVRMVLPYGPNTLPQEGIS